MKPSNLSPPPPFVPSEVEARATSDGLRARPSTSLGTNGLLLCFLLAGCNDMVRQPRYDDYGPGRLFADGKAMQAPPEGAVAQDAPALAAAEQRPVMSPALLRRGRERYAIACQPCHAADGSGLGTVPARGYPQPADFAAPAQRAQSPEHIHDVIERGYGVMYGHADRVPPADRWAITAYVLALREARR